MSLEDNNNNNPADVDADAPSVAHTLAGDDRRGVTATRVDDQQADSDDADAPEADSDADEDAGWRNGFDPDKAREQARKLRTENRRLRDRAKAAEGKVQSADELKQEATTLRGENMRLRVALEAGLPPEMIDLVRGDTRDELIENIDRLLTAAGPKRVPQQRPAERLRSGSGVAAEPVERDLSKIGARMFKR